MNKPCDILVIDDERVVLDAVTKVCTENGLIVQTASDADSALSQLEHMQCCLILCDIMLYGLDGLQFLEHLRLKQFDYPVIMITGYSTVEFAVKSINSGAIDFVPKPFTDDELLSAVHRGLRLLKLRHQSIGQEDCVTGKAIPYVPCPPHLLCFGHLSWTSIEDTGIALVGVTNLFMKTIGEVQEIEFFELGNEIVQGFSCSRVTGTDGLIHNVLSPISGNVAQVNERLKNEHSLLERDPYDGGWLYRVIPSDIEYELKNLIRPNSDLTRNGKGE